MVLYWPMAWGQLEFHSVGIILRAVYLSGKVVFGKDFGKASQNMPAYLFAAYYSDWMGHFLFC